jgi:hypothetical protein
MVKGSHSWKNPSVACSAEVLNQPKVTDLGKLTKRRLAHIRAKRLAFTELL